MPTFKSGAFAQQCFSSHPHSLTFKALTLITPAGPPTISPAITPAHPPDAPKRVPSPWPESAKTDSLPLGAADTGSLPITPARPSPAETGSVPMYRVVMTCNACDMRHRFVIQTLAARLGQREERDTQAISQLSCCATAHCLDLRISSMDVINDSVGLRCGECDRAYHLGVSAMETYQK